MLGIAEESWFWRSAARVLYVHFEDYGLVLLVYAYRKSAQEDIGEDEKQAINAQIDEIQKELDAGRQIE